MENPTTTIPPADTDVPPPANGSGQTLRQILNWPTHEEMMDEAEREEAQDIKAEREASQVWRMATDVAAHFTDRAMAGEIIRVMARQRLLAARLEE